MEILFSSPSALRPLSLQEALSQDAAGTVSALLGALCDLLFETSFLPPSSLLASVNAIGSQKAQFHKVLPGIDFNGCFSRKEMQIIGDASQNLYTVDDIEGRFFHYGHYAGIISAVLFFRQSESILKCWKEIHQSLRPWLVKCAISLVRKDIIDWIPGYTLSKKFDREKDYLQYLGHHAGRKRQAGAIEETSPSVPRDLLGHNAGRKRKSAAEETSTSGPKALRVLHPVTPSQSESTYTSNSPPKHDDARSLLALLYTPNTRVSKDVLLWGLEPQQRWNEYGNIVEIMPPHSGLNKYLIRLFSSRDRLETTIRLCIENESIIQWMSSSRSLVYSIGPSSEEQIKRSFSLESMYLLQLEYIAYIFPRISTSDSLFQHRQKTLLPYLERLWNTTERMPHFKLPLHIRTSLLEASLAAYKLLDVHQKKTCMRMMERLQDLELPLYVRLAITVQKSVSLRFQGEHDESDKVLNEASKCGPVDLVDLRSHCLYGRLILSQVENAILRKDFGRVRQCLSIWESPESPSELEIQVARLHQTVINRFYRYTGEFEDAEEGLGVCLKFSHNDASRYHILHHLGDVCCERGLPQDAIKHVLGEVDQLRAQGKGRSKAFRRISLPLAEAYIMKWRSEDAPISIVKGEAVVREILHVFEDVGNLDVSDQLNHVRSKITLARIHWYKNQQELARLVLKEALSLTEKYKTFSNGNYYMGFISLFLSAVEFKLQLYDEGKISLAIANRILNEQMPRHFMPGLGSYFLSQLLGTPNPPAWPWSPITETQLFSISP